MDKLKTTKILGIVGAILLIVGNFFPFVTVKLFGMKESVSFMEGDGIFTLILGIIALAMVLIDFILAKIPEGKFKFLFKLRNQKLLLIPAIISAIIVIIDITNTLDESYGLAHIGFGFWVLVIGIVALAAHAFIYKGNK